MILYICQTMDGFIATEDGAIDFLEQFNEQIANSENPQIANSYPNFMQGITNVVEGYKTYQQVSDMGYGAAYRDFNHYVLTRNKQEQVDENVTAFLDLDQLAELSLKSEGTFLIGGAQIISEAFKRQMINQLIIFNLPYYLGQGITLFNNIEQNFKLKIKEIASDQSFYQVHYLVEYK